MTGIYSSQNLLMHDTNMYQWSGFRSETNLNHSLKTWNLNSARKSTRPSWFRRVIPSLDPVKKSKHKKVDNTMWSSKIKAKSTPMHNKPFKRSTHCLYPCNQVGPWFTATFTTWFRPFFSEKIIKSHINHFVIKSSFLYNGYYITWIQTVNSMFPWMQVSTPKISSQSVYDWPSHCDHVKNVANLGKSNSTSLKLKKAKHKAMHISNRQFGLPKYVPHPVQTINLLMNDNWTPHAIWIKFRH